MLIILISVICTATTSGRERTDILEIKRKVWSKRIVYLIIAILITLIMCLACVQRASAETITITNGYANIRSQAGQNNKYLGRVVKGESFELLDQSKAPNGKVWYKADYNGKIGWTCSSFSKLTPSGKTPLPSGNQKITITGEPTNVRSGAGYNYKVIGKAHRGNILGMYTSAKDGNGNTWYKVKYNGTDGWVLASLAEMGEKKISDKPANSKHGKLIDTFTATAYCGTEGGGENHRTATGYSLVRKSRTDAMTVAVDKRVIPLNTKLYIEFPSPYSHFSGYYTARDTGGAIKGNKLDLYIGWSNIREAYQFGVRKGCKVYYA